MAESKKSGAAVLCEALKEQGVEYMFGIVGVPVIEVGVAAQVAGIKYIGMRNEQAAAYAASAIGYLTGRPAVCLTVPGPGMLHVIPGMVNANENCWPMIVISGCMEDSQEITGSFQELNQVAAAKPFCKFAARPSGINRIPVYVEKAVRSSLYGRPGACYIDLPANIINGKHPADEIVKVPFCPNPPKCYADPLSVKKATELLFLEAKTPLVIIGKGAAYGRAEEQLKRFVLDHNLPFLPTPMGKGVLPDDHPLCVGPARSRALQKADVILLVGARLNWMLHFGQAPRFDPNVKIIQIDICAEEMHNNVKATFPLVGDVESVISQFNEEITKMPGSLKLNLKSSWWSTLKEKIIENQKTAANLIAEPSPPLNYYNAFYEIEKHLSKDTVLISEGSNTMDISRSTFPNYYPRHRLDAGTYGTMGVGLGFAIAAAFWCRDHAPHKKVVCIQGDSAFGFSGMEVETVCRYQLPILFIVINNNGIAMGVDEDGYTSALEGDPSMNLLPTALMPNARYEKVMEAFGGKGFLVSKREELSNSVKEGLQSQQPCLINCAISPYAGKKPQEFFWLTAKI